MLLSLVPLALQPIWLFQGLEKMYLSTLASVVSRLISVTMILTLLKENNLDMIGYSNLLGNTVGLVFTISAISKLGIRLCKPSLNFAQEVIFNSVHFFLSRLAVSVYSAGGVIFLGFFGYSSREVAFYSVADQVYKGTQIVINPVVQVMYPTMIRTKNYIFLFKVAIALIVLSIITEILFYFYGIKLLQTLFGTEYSGSFSACTILLATFTVQIPSMLLGYPFLGTQGKSNLVNNSVIFASLIQIILFSVIYFNKSISTTSVALTIFITECCVLVARIFWSVSLIKDYVNRDSSLTKKSPPIPKSNMRS
jgi:polysaccharide transporter, PST family